MTKIMLHGMTDRPIDWLVSLARSWSHAPELKLSGRAGYRSRGYDPAERAYVLVRNASTEPERLTLELDGSEESPIVNPAFIVENWGSSAAELSIGGRAIERGKAFRFGHRHRLEGIDLVVWLRVESAKPLQVSLAPVDG